MKKTILIVVLLCVVVAYANNQDDFQLGVYSHLSNKQYVYDHRILFKDWMKTLSYNVNIVNLYLEGLQPNGEMAYNLTAFTTMLNEMNVDSIDAIIRDLCWDSVNRYSINSITKSNHVLLEAEVKNDLDNLPDYPADNDQYWYGSSYIYHEENPLPPIPAPSNSIRIGQPDPTNTSWECIPARDQIGYAYGDLQHRWDVSANNYPLIKDLFSVCNSSSDADDCFFYITYRVKINGIIDNSTPLLCFRVTGNKFDNSTIPPSWVAYTTDVEPVVSVSITGNPTPRILNDGI